MTNEEFDKRLIGRINEVFTDMEDTSADEGWLLLREKYPPKDSKKPLAWFWLGTIAAMLLAGLGAGIWLNERKHEHKNTTIVKADTTKGINKQMQQTAPKTITDSHTLPIPKKVQDDVTGQSRSATGSKVNVKMEHTALAFSEQNKDKSAATKTMPQHNITSTSSENNNERSTLADQASKISGEGALVETNTQAKTDTVKTADDVTNKKAIVAKPEKTADNKKTTPVNIGQKIIFGVYASGFYNYASGSTNQFNLGGGATMDIKMGDHFRFSTGLGITQNTLDYYQEPTAFSFGFGTRRSALVMYSPFPVIITTFKSYQTSLLALSVPTIFKYQFAKTYSSVSMGFISSTYINEYYDETFTTTSINAAQSGNGQVTPSSTTTEDHKITQKHFSKYDILRTVNLSFGLGYPVGKKSVLIVEPFLNAPIGGLGYYNFAYGSWGLNLKLNFETVKK